MIRSKVIRKRTRKNERASGSVTVTFDHVAAYALECGHVRNRSHLSEFQAHSVGPRIKCPTCSEADRG